jgi:hypothetical protein
MRHQKAEVSFSIKLAASAARGGAEPKTQLPTSNLKPDAYYFLPPTSNLKPPTSNIQPSYETPQSEVSFLDQTGHLGGQRRR